jgi:catechol 2,3-dioxygenase-like lactoylglutathione lyase family enzyme
MILEHIAFNLSDPAAAASWYVEHLGLRLVVANAEPPFIHFLADEQGSMIELYSNPAGAIPDYASMNPFTLHLAFGVDDIAAEHQRLLEAGATAEGAIAPTPTGDLLVFLRDPWGTPLQLVRRKTPLL